MSNIIVTPHSSLSCSWSLRNDVMRVRSPIGVAVWHNWRGSWTMDWRFRRRRGRFRGKNMHENRLVSTATSAIFRHERILISIVTVLVVCWNSRVKNPEPSRVTLERENGIRSVHKPEEKIIAIRIFCSQESNSKALRKKLYLNFA